MARPSKYGDIDLKLVEKYCSMGLTDEQLAGVLGIAKSTLNEYKKDYPEFSDSIKKGKLISDDRVERSLFERATGYEHEDVYISTYEGKVIVTDIVKHYPPDPTSMIFWLKNRRPKEWRDKTEIEHKGISEIIKQAREAVGK